MSTLHVRFAFRLGCRLCQYISVKAKGCKLQPESLVELIRRRIGFVQNLVQRTLSEDQFLSASRLDSGWLTCTCIEACRETFEKKWHAKLWEQRPPRWWLVVSFRSDQFRISGESESRAASEVTARYCLAADWIKETHDTR